MAATEEQTPPTVSCDVLEGSGLKFTMRLLMGLPMMRATMPRWSAFSRLWLSG